MKEEIRLEVGLVPQQAFLQQEGVFFEIVLRNVGGGRKNNSVFILGAGGHTDRLIEKFRLPTHQTPAVNGVAVELALDIIGAHAPPPLKVTVTVL